jgi:hypothetical protein
MSQKRTFLRRFKKKLIVLSRWYFEAVITELSTSSAIIGLNMAAERLDIRYFPPKVVKSERGESQPAISEQKTKRTLSPQHRARISEGLRGREVSPETRDLLSAAQIGRSRGDFSAEHKARLSEAAQKSWEKKKIRAKRSKKRSPQARARMSEAQLNRQERIRQQQAAQPHSTEVFPAPEK